MLLYYWCQGQMFVPLLGDELAKVKHLAGWVQGELRCQREPCSAVDSPGEHWTKSDPDRHLNLPLLILASWWKVLLPPALLSCSAPGLLSGSAPGLPSLMNQLVLAVPWQLTWLSLKIWVCDRLQVSSRTSSWLWVLMSLCDREEL